MPFKNKEDRSAWQKNWYLANKKEIAARDKARYEAKKDGLYTIYLLPEENYVGMTSHLHSRLINHKKSGRDISDVEILGKYKTKKMARYVEAMYHDEGYNGRHRYDKRNNTIAGVDFTESLNNLNNLL